MLYFSFWVLLLIGCQFGILKADSEDENARSNVIMIMFDDLGRTDFSLFGAEWDTPNIDSFLSNSAVLSHHYIGYVCSASRSQFFTGRYSYHNGYGTLNVFDIDKLGTMPLATPTFIEYLQKYGGYNTYGLGKWQMGTPTYSNLASNRGFDHFWGFNGGMEDYHSKLRSAQLHNVDFEFIDFVYNTEVNEDWQGGYSTDQYMEKAMEIIKEESEKEEEEPFFMYIGLQAIHIPFAEDTPYYKQCQETAMPKIDTNDNAPRMGVCESIVGADYQLGRLLEFFKSTVELQQVWDNTVIIMTSDNGGDISGGSCNYPLRGGKNTFFEGGQRVVASVGGGVLPDDQRGIVLDGLVSNVDWFPTILAFAGLIPKDWTHVLFDGDDVDSSLDNDTEFTDMSIADAAMVFDGYNMYEYIMDSDKNGARDHILLHIQPKSQQDETDYTGNNGLKLTKSIHEYEFGDFREIAMIFYDDAGHLWKYFDVSASDNPVGNPSINAGWCLRNTGDTTDDKGTYSVTMDESLTDGYLQLGLFDLTDDITESTNYLEDLQDDTTLTLDNIPEDLGTIITTKLNHYVNKDGSYNMGSMNSVTMFGNLACFTTHDADSEISTDAAFGKSVEMNAWMPYWSMEEWRAKFGELCGIDETHPLHQLFESDLVLPELLTPTDDSDQVSFLNPNLEELERRSLGEMSEFTMDNVNDDDIDSQWYDDERILTKSRSIDSYSASELNDRLTTMSFILVGVLVIVIGFGILVYNNFGDKSGHGDYIALN